MAMLVAGMTSCKYDEGPFLSFVPKTERVTNTWVVNTATVNGADGTIPNFKEITFFKEGGCQIIYDTSGTEYAFTGDWAFTDKKLAIHIDADDELTHTSTYVSDWTILRLKEEELKVSFTDNSDLYVVAFKPGA